MRQVPNPKEFCFIIRINKKIPSLFPHCQHHRCDLHLLAVNTPSSPPSVIQPPSSLLSISAKAFILKQKVSLLQADIILQFCSWLTSTTYPVTCKLLCLEDTHLHRAKHEAMRGKRPVTDTQRNFTQNIFFNGELGSKRVFDWTSSHDHNVGNFK